MLRGQGGGYIAAVLKSLGNAKAKRILGPIVAPGNPPRKSNSRRIVRVGGKPRVILSGEAQAWLAAACMLCPADLKIEVGSREYPVVLLCDMFYASHRSDLSVELAMDMLQKAGVVKDDRWVVATVARKYREPGAPRAEILVVELASWPEWAAANAP